MNYKFIRIANEGQLRIGSEDTPFTNEAKITLHGHVRCTELPIYGCKGIGVREGLLDLHGRPIANTWTRYISNTIFYFYFIIPSQDHKTKEPSNRLKQVKLASNLHGSVTVSFSVIKGQF